MVQKAPCLEYQWNQPRRVRHNCDLSPFLPLLHLLLFTSTELRVVTGEANNSLKSATFSTLFLSLEPIQP